MRTVEKAILNNITPKQIHENLNELISQKLSLRINIKSIIDSNSNISTEIKSFLNNLLGILENGYDGRELKDSSQLINPNVLRND